MRHGVLALLLAVIALFPASQAAAHGVELTYAITPVVALQIDLQATDLAGEPLAGANVTMVAPDAPDTPWNTGETDDNGHFSFLPDASRTGVWEVRVSQDERRAWVRLPVEFAPGNARIALSQGVTVSAQGMVLTYAAREVTTVQVALDAAFESGEAMSGAQVTVYAPDDPQTPWLTGACDDRGQFVFTADLNKPGTWEIQVRKAGHGEWLKIALEPDMIEVVETNAAGTGEAVQTLRIADGGGRLTGGDSGFSTGQILLMSGSVIWGLVGTALYMSRRRTTGDH